MALATRCPNCQALFRVAAEQLRSRGGMVRCGSCRRVFNAIAGLDYLDAQRLAVDGTGGAPVTTGPAPGADNGQPVRAAAAGSPPGASATPREPARAPQAEARAVRPRAQGVRDEPPRQAAARVRDAGSSWIDLAALSVAPADPPGETAEEPQPGTSGGPDTLFAISKPSIDGAGPPDEAQDSAQTEDAANAPSFLRERAANPSRSARFALALGALLLLAGLGLQIALLLRSPLIVALPGLRPALQAVCAPFGCTASWPMRPDLLAVVSSELQAVPGTDLFELDAVLRNRAAFALAVPAIELTISDDAGHAVVRRIFLPADYLGAGAEGRPDPAAANIGAGADLSLRIRFAFPGGNAAGFEAYPFYP
jgi:predicted Zn finger-like uncharacterized protein